MSVMKTDAENTSIVGNIKCTNASKNLDIFLLRKIS